MKKIFAVLALVAVLASCKDKKKADTPPAGGDTPAVSTNPPANNPPTGGDANMNSDVPKFADADVQKYVDDYTAYVKAIVDAYKSKDMTKAAELSGKAQEWSGKSMDISKKLAANPDDLKKFSDYMTKLSQDMTAAMTAK